MAQSVSLRLHDVRTMGRRHLAVILEFLDLGMDTMVTGLQGSGVECLHKDVLRREVNSSVSETALYFRRSEEVKDLYLWLFCSNEGVWILP